MPYHRYVRVAAAEALLASLHPGPAEAQGVIRHSLPGSDFPILSSVEVPTRAITV